VRTAYETGKLTQIISEMKRYDLMLLAISELRWPFTGKIISDDTTVIYSGGKKHEKRVGLLFYKEAAYS